ncbi:MAG TPA: hypothetical protein DCQ64_12590 [Candidatus Rokubacteria bacterium]|nr:hypothetical protein [Candidatus Rokubacteria bacterium]
MSSSAPEVEAAVLAAVLLDSRYTYLLDELAQEDFSAKAHQTTFEAMRRVFRDDGHTPDIRTVQAKLDSMGQLERVGGVAFLAALDLALPDLSGVPQYVEILRDRRLRRVGKELCTRGAEFLDNGAKSAREAVSRIRQDLLDAETLATPAAYCDWGETLSETVSELSRREVGQPLGVPSGLIELDRRLQGFSPGQLILLAGRPGLGKTSLALHIAHHLSYEREVPVAFFSLEMDRRELALRILSLVSERSYTELRQGLYNDHDRASMDRWAAELATAPLRIFDQPRMTVAAIAGACRKLRDEQRLGAVLIDYVQLLDADSRRESRALEVGDISRSLKQMARELEIPVLPLCQLSRASEKEKRKPMLTDLRDSGTLEQDADVVVFLYRPGKEDTETELLIEKHRNGATGMARVGWRARNMKFFNIAEQRDFTRED